MPPPAVQVWRPLIVWILPPGLHHHPEPSSEEVQGSLRELPYRER